MCGEPPDSTTARYSSLASIAILFVRVCAITCVGESISYLSSIL